MGTVPQVAWLIAAVCFILSLGGLSRHESARRGNFLGIVGMMLAIGAAFWQATESELLGGLSQNGLLVLVGALVAWWNCWRFFGSSGCDDRDASVGCDPSQFCRSGCGACWV